MSFQRPGSVHIDTLLTSVSVGFLGSLTPLSTQIFPVVPVTKQSNAYRIYPKSTFFRPNAKKRAPGTETVGISMGTTLGHYNADVWGLHADIDDDTRANADSDLTLDQDAVRLLTQGMMATREVAFAQRYLQPGVWGADITPATKWDTASGDPAGDVNRAVKDFTVRNGIRPNTIVAGLNVHTALKNSPAIIERVKYTNDGSVTTAMLMNLFEMTGPGAKYIVADQVISPEVASIMPTPVIGQYGNPDDVDLELICPDVFALFYVPPSPGLLTPAPGYTFNWSSRVPGGANEISTYNFRLNRIKSDRIETEMAYDQKEVCLSLGTMFSNVLSA